MVKKSKLLALALATVMSMQLLAPYHSKADAVSVINDEPSAEQTLPTEQKQIETVYDDILEEEVPLTDVHENAPAEEETLELSEIEEEFNPNAYEEDGLMVAPLKVDTAVSGPRVGVRAALPKKFDLRATGMVSPVKDQGPNGSCWAFATYGSMESILLRSKKGLFDFSEKNLRNLHGFDWDVNKGGNRDMAAAYLASGKGPILEEDDPYDPVISVSPSNIRRTMDMDKIIYLPDVDTIDDIANLKIAVSEYGGVYSTVNNSNYYENTKTNSMYNPGSGSANHAVTIVGWDDTFPRTAFTKPAPGDGAWICKNSWGNKYMDNGYYYVSYFDKFIGKSPTVFIPKKTDLRGIIHQYDPLGATRSVGFKGEGFMANIFVSKYEELLHEVGLYNIANQTSYEVYLVRDVKSTSDLTNNRIKIAEGQFLYPGYYTVPVEPSQLKSGEQFAIVVYMNSTRSNNNTPLPIETRIPGYTSNAKAMEGQSYFSSKGTGWTDLITTLPDANFCVKAITTTGDEVPDKDLDEDDHNTDITIDGEVKVRSITFDSGSQGFISVDKKGILRYTVAPENATPELEFGSMDEKTAVFREGGILYPVAPGNTNVFIKTKDGSIIARFNVQVVNTGIRVPGRQPIEIIGENDYVPEPEPEPEPEIPDDIKPEPIEPEYDPTLARDIYMKIVSDTMVEGTTYELEPKIGTFPETAKRDFIYFSDNLSVAEVDPQGRITANSIGTANISVMTDNNLKTVFRIRVVPDKSKQVIEITNFYNSDRKVGIFTLYAQATVDGRPYNGPGKITVTSGERVKEVTVYFDAGLAKVKFNGFNFGVWRKDFNATLVVRDKISKLAFSFK